MRTINGRYQFLDNEWLGDMIKRIGDSAGAHPMFSALGQLEIINDYSKKYHHQTNRGKADSEPINDGELQSFAKRTLCVQHCSELKNYPL